MTSCKPPPTCIDASPIPDANDSRMSAIPYEANLTPMGAMALSLDAAAEVFREAMRDTVKRYSLWYLIQGGLLIAAGVLAIIYPVLSSTAVVVLLGWLLIISGVVQGLSLIGARHVPPFLAAAHFRHPGRADRVPVSARSGTRANDDRATPDRVLHDRGHIEGGLCPDDPALSQLGLGAGSGLVGILLALILWANLPVTTLWLIGVLLGINLISVGAAIGYLAWQVRQS